jgi:hypothetical protein
MVTSIDGLYPIMRQKWLIEPTPLRMTDADIENPKPRKYEFGIWAAKMPTDYPPGYYGPKTLREIEDYVLQCDRRNSMMTVDAKEMTDPHNSLINMMCQINRATVWVGKSTRRGRANHVVMSPYGFELLARCERISVGDSTPLSEQSSLRQVDVITDWSPNYRWYLREDWDNEHPIVVSYKGSTDFDAGLFAISDGNGAYWMGLPQQHHFEPYHLSYYNHLRVIEFPRV